ncbi:MAG: hypothetical protein WKF75_06660 [Singulisphaera sp.]
MMVSPIWLVGTVLALQVPPPPSTSSPSKRLRAESRAILGRERAELEALAGRLKARGQGDAAAEVLARADPPPLPDGSSRFVPLPAVIPAPAGLPIVAKAAPPWHSELRTIRTTTAKALFDLATRAASEGSKQYTLADECLRAVLGRQPDHAEARRLLGYVPHEGGWATPYAVRELGKGKVLHPTFGWVEAAWVPHLDQGSCPPPRDGQKVRWLPAEQADALRNQWGRGWNISTEHFEIETNVPLSEVIAFGRQLEGFHDLFYALLADVIGDSCPLARRFQDKTLVEVRPARPHLVYYFATRDEYLDHVLRRHGPSYEETLGAYIPPKPGKGKRAPAYFFRDVEGQLAASATLYHEVSHQLLFESGAPNAYRRTWAITGLRGHGDVLRDRHRGARWLAPVRRPGRPSHPGGPEAAGRRGRPHPARAPRAPRHEWPVSRRGQVSAIRRGHGPDGLPDERARRRVPRRIPRILQGRVPGPPTPPHGAFSRESPRGLLRDPGGPVPRLSQDEGPTAPPALTGERRPSRDPRREGHSPT